MKIIIREKDTLEEIVRMDYFDSSLDHKIAAVYAINCVVFMQKWDVSNLMSFVMSLRDSALDWSIHKIEEETLKRFESQFDISFENVGEKI